MNWPTTLNAAGQAPSVMELLVNPEFTRQASYLAQVAAKYKEIGCEPEGLQIPIVAGEFRATLPLGLLDKHGNRAMVYTNCAPWNAGNISTLKAWAAGMRQMAGVPLAVPLVVAAQYDCAQVRSLPEVQQFVILRLLDVAGPEKRPPPGELGARLADVYVRHSASCGVALDYSPESLAAVDDYLGRLRQGSDADLSELLRAAGAYVGEVLIRHLGGRWLNVEGSSLASVASGPIIVELSGECCCNPLGKALKRFDLGDGDSVVFFFRALKHRDQMEGRLQTT